MPDASFSAFWQHPQIVLRDNYIPAGTPVAPGSRDRHSYNPAFTKPKKLLVADLDLGPTLMKFKLVSLACVVLLVASAGPTLAETVTVGTVSELQNAVATANSVGGSTTILVQDGTYTLSDTLYVDVPNVTIAGQSGDRTKVVIQGDAMSSSANVGNVIRVAASNFQLRDVTLQKSRWHLIQIAGESNADSPIIKNCILRDAYEQILKVSQDSAIPNVTSDNGLVENCLFEYTAGVGPQYYIGGIDAHGAGNWIVRNNIFRSIISPSDFVAEYAIHFWDHPASNNIVEKNLIVNCDRGIGFGLHGRGNTGGIIRNNMIYHAANTGAFADVAIALADSPHTQVYNNTVFMEHDFPWAIEYRFPSTTEVLIANNLTNLPILSRDDAAATVTNNVTSASESWLLSPSSGDLHLAFAVSSVVDAGLAISGLTDDYDGQNRPQGVGVDIGADEYLTIEYPAIDIKPGSDPNSINLCSGGSVPVAILGTDTFDAYDVNTETLRFAEASLKVVGKRDPQTQCSYEDVNGDYIDDLLCHFLTQDFAAIDGESTTATVSGELNDGTPIEGDDNINIVKDTCD
jgi:hypothetical protein